MKVFLIFFYLLGSAQLLAAQCPWQKAEELLHLDSDEQVPERWLSASEISEDLACLKLIFENFYVAQTSVETSPVIAALNSYNIPSEGMTAEKFMQVLHGFHKDLYDTHQGYVLRPTQLHSPSRNPRSVSINEQLDAEVIFERDKYVYFKVGSLKSSELSIGQAKFIEFVQKNDRPLVIDLRGNGGGDNVFAETLAQVLFTATQNIPQHRFEQVDSPFVSTGLLNHLRVLDYTGIEEYERQVLDFIRGKSIFELLPFKWNIEKSELKGSRPKSYSSSIVLLTDGFCASACETIVEKLNTHPKVKTVGQSTYGALHYGNATLFQLPHSAIWAKTPSAREVMENDAPEGEGYAPDVVADFINLETILDIHD